MSGSEIEELLARSIDGDEKGLTSFFSTLLSSEVFAIRRYQHLPVSDAPEYPSEIFDLLAVKGKTHVTIPIFLNPSRIREWASADFLIRKIRFSELIVLVPDDWWVVVNPGWEVEKEISPWEISQLRRGVESIPEIVRDNLPDEEVGLSLEPIDQAEFPGLVSGLVEYAKSQRLIDKIAVYRQVEAESSDGKFVVVASIDDAPSETLDVVRSEIQAISQRALIGELPIRVVTDRRMAASLAGGVAEGVAVVYQRRPGSIRQNLANLFNRFR